MAGFLGFLVLYCIGGFLFGGAAAYIEGRVNSQPPRYRNSILWTILLGPIGFMVVLVRSSLNYSGGMRADLRAAAQQKQVPQYYSDPQDPSNPGPK